MRTVKAVGSRASVPSIFGGEVGRPSVGRGAGSGDPSPTDPRGGVWRAAPNRPAGRGQETRAQQTRGAGSGDPRPTDPRGGVRRPAPNRPQPRSIGLSPDRLISILPPPVRRR